MQPEKIAQELVQELNSFRFRTPVTHVYNPLTYAWNAHCQYLERYGNSSREIVFIGMNPGPWGMAQTGVPFGEVNFVRDWLAIDAAIGKPEKEHPKRPIEGLNCTRSEVSGKRLWGWAKDRFKTPERFFSRFFVLNYCPLMFMEKSGKNFTPNKLPARERALLEKACDRALRRSIEFFKPRHVIGVGAFAQSRAEQALDGLDVRIGKILHPSPASPAANRHWAKDAEKMLREQGIRLEE